ncbi:EamA family transporter [Natronorubrum halophilum]|uniref:EamA family transporter n=1 Tax=Natronorubrum halophilum TaxID=1702106 RepID=UPI0010C22270|nr:EamA family transporter [Natronorubrum halophilum]
MVEIPSSYGVAYAGTGAVIWGAFLFYLKYHFSEYPPALVLAVTNVFSVAWFLAAIGLTANRTVVDGIVSLPPSDWVAAFVVVSVFSLGLLMLYHALAVGDVSYVAPLSKLSPAFVLPLEVIVLGQFLKPVQVMGIIIATGAVYIANYQGGGLHEPFRTAISARPARLALASALLLGIVDVSQRALLQDGGITPEVWTLVKLAGVPLVLSPIVWRNWTPSVWADLRKFAVAGAFVGVGEWLTALAFSSVPASVASPIISLQAVVAVVLGGIVLGEDRLALRLVAAGSAAVGVALIALG